jgi:hypothetical protein
MARDVRDAQVPQRPWMAESGPDRIDSNRLKAILAPFGAHFVRRPLQLQYLSQPRSTQSHKSHTIAEFHLCCL